MEKAGGKQDKDSDAATGASTASPKAKRSVGLHGTFFEPGYARCLCGKTSSEMDDFLDE
ncbi:unnamed protein product, partial [Haemonchus placei]|uniref:Uncharacterized protein n=2 Tax=Haemonchus TaxID=6288 RepID=A0A0N4VZW1_HAEPC